jgi:predicted metal-dependent hydrolase
MNTQAHTEAQPIDIIPRHMGFAFPADTPKYWFDGDPWMTHLLNALSLTFPSGEAEFVRSVRVVRDRVKDPQLLEDIRAFTAQEMHHSKEHQAFNEWLRGLGLPVNLPAEANLAATAALEHFTAILADAFMEEGLTDEMHENVKWLWLWHAIEETEHKAVAFDVYRAIGGKYAMRVLVMLAVTRRFILNSTRFQLMLLRADGQLTNLRSMGRYLWRFWGPRGYFTKLLPAYLSYYRPDFHPWQQDNRSAVARLKAQVEARAKRVFEGSRTRALGQKAA